MWAQSLFYFFLSFYCFFFPLLPFSFIRYTRHNNGPHCLTMMQDVTFAMIFLSWGEAM